MSRPLVSVIIGTYNRAAYIRETLDSVFAQDWPVELIVVDDASIDKTVEILETYGERIILSVLPENSTRPAVPRNAALKQVSGDYVAFLDSDDRWEPGKLEKQVGFMEAHPEFGMVHGYSRIIDEQSVAHEVRHEGGLPPSGDIFSALLEHCFISISTVLVRREVLDRVGLMNEEPFYRAKEDYEWFLRVAAAYEVGRMDEVLACYRRASTGISAQDTAWRMQPEDAPMHQRIWMRPELWRDKADERTVRDIFLKACRANCIHWRDRGKAGRAMWFCRLGLGSSPFNGTLWTELAKSVLRGLVPRRTN